MGTLFTLANESLFQIIDYLVPDGIEELTQASKPLYHFCAKQLQKHRSNKRKYKTVTFSRNPPRGGLNDWHDHPLALLRDILLAPRLTLYTKTVVFGYWAPDIPDYAPGYGSECERRREYCDVISKEVGHAISAEVLRCPYIPRDEVGQWTEDVKSGDFHTTAFLLLTLLPNVTEIQGRHQYFGDSLFQDMLDVVAAAVDEPNFSHPTDRAFGNLTKVNLSEEWEMNDIEVDLLIRFSAVPSVRVLEANGVTQVRAGNPRRYPSQRSGVTTIRLMRSNISAELFSSLFEHTPDLKSFTYQHHIWSVSTKHWEPWKINLALQKYTWRSLEHLDMVGLRESGLRDTGPPIGSLRPFPNLKWIRLEAGMLRCDEKDGNAQRLVDILPASTEHLVLLGPSDAAQTAKMFDRLAESKTERLSNLTNIWFEICNNCCSKFCPHLRTKDVCADAGIESSIVGHFDVRWHSRREHEEYDVERNDGRQMLTCPLNRNVVRLPLLRM